MREDEIKRELLQGVWGVALSDVASTSAAYLDHCNELRSTFAEEGFIEANRQDIISIVDLVKNEQAQTLDVITQSIRAADPKCAQSISDDVSVQNILDFVLQLWLFITQTSAIQHSSSQKS